MLVGTIFFYFPETKFKTTQYFQPHILRYKNIYFHCFTWYAL